MPGPLRIDPDQRFTCAQCGRCCRRWEILVSPAEAESLRSRHAERWFREDPASPEGTSRDPFESVAGVNGYHRIRKRQDGACGFLSLEGRCRLHEELGAKSKPLTCRSFPYTFHDTPASVVVTASFGCPTIVANTGEPAASGRQLDELKGLRTEWFDTQRPTAAPRRYVAGRAIDQQSLQILRDSLLRMLSRTNAGGGVNLRSNVARMAQTLEDLTRSRVIALTDADFAEYLALTTRHAAQSDRRSPAREPSRIGRLLQHGFLFIVAALRTRIERSQASRWQLRLTLMRLLAHFHGVGPAVGRINLPALKHARVDIDAPDIQPIVHRYLQATISALGATSRPVLDELAIAVSQLNAACALAVMDAHAASRAVDRQIFTEALMESVDTSQLDERGVAGRAVARFAGGVEALYFFGSTRA